MTFAARVSNHLRPRSLDWQLGLVRKLCVAEKSWFESLCGEARRRANNGDSQWEAPGCLVEAAGIEPASASPPLRGLHAYSVFNLITGYPTGREDRQPVQQRFNGSDPGHVLTAVLCR